MVVIRGRGRLMLPSSPPSPDCPRLTFYVSDLVLLLAWQRCAGPDAESATCQGEEAMNPSEVSVNYLDIVFFKDLLIMQRQQLCSDSRSSSLVSLKKVLVG
ncbi:hypothetical protein GOODEAATRI_010829 [Goodea atripinnis]|uniref:Uncharacterized protein n=1 Tax=Goodea atripinnis TaxID=208336 RepID=A0ABV0PML1_9TELE